MQVAQSFIYGYQCSKEKAAEDAAQRDSNPYLIGMLQFAQLIALAALAEQACQAAGKAELSSYFFWPLAVAIPVLQAAEGTIKYLEEEGKKHHFIEKILPYKQKIVWLNQHAGSIYQVAAIVSCLAMACFGWYGCASLAAANLLFGYLDRHHLIPRQINKIYWTVMPVLSAAEHLVVLSVAGWPASLLGKIYLIFPFFDIFDVGDYLYRYFNHLKIIPYDKADHSHRLSHDQFNQIMHGTIELEIDKTHLNIIPFPDYLQGDYSQENLKAVYEPLKQFCENFKWNTTNQHLLDSAVEKDSRYEEAVQHDSRFCDKVLYVKTQLQTLIDNIAEEKIEAGSNINYPVLQNYLACIAKELPKADKLLQVRILLQLATEGGERCSTGIYYQLETAAVSLLQSKRSPKEDREGLPLKQKILMLLQQERSRVVQGLYDLYAPSLLGFNMIAGGKEKVHAMNQFVETSVPRNFHLPNHGAEEDLTVTKSCLVRFILPKAVLLKESYFWDNNSIIVTLNSRRQAVYREFQGYSRQAMLKVLRENRGEFLDNSQIYAWAQDWIEQTNLSEEDKEEFNQKLSNASFELFDGSFDPLFLQAMLVDMGVLKIKNSSAG